MRWPWRRRALREAELDEEIRAHFRMAVEARVRRGESPRDAERAVRREFGNLLQIKEITRAMWGGVWWEHLVQDSRYALRSLRRAPAYSAAAVVTLALGLSATTVVFAVVNGVLLRPLPFPRPDRLVLIAHGPPPGPFLTTSGMADRDYLELRRYGAELAHLATFSNQPAALTGAGEPARLNAGTVTTEFFDVLGVPPFLGRGFASGDTTPEGAAVVVLGDALWRARFGADPGVVGATVKLDGVSRTVAGVMPPGFDFPNGAEVWLPLEIRIDPGSGRSRAVIGRLADDATLASARAAFAGFVAGLPAAEEAVISTVEPLEEYLVSRVRHGLLVLLAAVGFVLLIACANVTNLMLMRAVTRERELALRASLGAGRARLLRQLLTESLFIGALGGAVGVPLAWLGVRSLMAILPIGQIPRSESIGFDGVVLATGGVLALLAGLGLGVLPALSATRRRVGHGFGALQRSSRRRGGRLRSALAFGQVALALVLLTGAGLLLRSFHNMRAVDLGFVPAAVLTMTVDLPESRYPDASAMVSLHDRVLERLAGTPAVEEAGAVNWRPFGTMLISGDFVIEDRLDVSIGNWADKLAVSPDYFSAMGVRMLHGRAFTTGDRRGAPGVVVISRTLADRFWPGADSIGRRLALRSNPAPDDWLTIVGVADDILQRDVTAARSAAIYTPYAQVANPFFLGRMTYVVRSAAGLARTTAALREAVHAADPELPVHTVASMDELVASMTLQPRFRSWTLAVFAVIALALAVVGIYGVLAYSVAQQRFEIGVRMALGARASDIIGAVLRHSLVLIGAGLLLGLAGAAGVTRVLRGYLFQVEPADPLTFVAGASLLALTALLAAWLPARRAGRVEPATALKAE